MSPVGKAIFELVPYLIACVLGAIVPRRQGKLERAALGIIAVLTVAFVMGLWSSASGPTAAAGGAVKPEWPHLLTVIVFLPIAGALAVLFLPRQSPLVLRWFTLGVLLLDFVVSLALLGTPMTNGWHHQYIADWLPSFGIRYHVAVDGISYWLVMLTTMTTPIALYAALGSVKERVKDFCFAILLLHAGMLGAFVSLDLFLFYVFWELMLVPMIILIGVWGGVERIKAAYKFFLYTMAGSVLMLAAILYLVWSHKQVAGYLTFDYLALSHLALPRTAAWLCFAAFALAFAIKVPMFPLHTWLPDAHVQAPTGGSVILAAVLLKLGTYGYLRFCMGMFAGPAWQAGVTLAGVAVLGGITYGALVAWRQDDIKRLVAYSSVAHMGFIMLGVFAATNGSVQGAILQMLNHGVSTGALFLLVGVIYDRRHTRLVQEFGGIAKVMPIYTTIFIVITMSSIGVPGTNGFVGEFMIVMGAFVSTSLGVHGQLQAATAAFGVVLAAVYMLTMVQKVFFGPLKNPANKHLVDLNVRETIALAPLVALVFVIGFFPKLFLGPMTESVSSLVDHYRDGRAAYLASDWDSNRIELLPRRGGPLEKGYPTPPTTFEQGQTAANDGATTAPAAQGDSK
ncbi:MAG: NADH-quinone oxidoreductase subunit M [Polyangiaceae bacterium]